MPGAALVDASSLGLCDTLQLPFLEPGRFINLMPNVHEARLAAKLNRS